MAQLKDLLVTGDTRVIGNLYNNSPKVAFGTCDTAGGTAAKVVTVDDPTWNLQVGDIIGIKFTNTNTAGSMSLNVNGSGAKQIAYNTSRPYTGTDAFITGNANRTVFYQYDGTYWYWFFGGWDSNNDTYTTAKSWTGGGTAAKTATCHDYTATANSWIVVQMVYANTSAGAITLNINGQGAKPIYINGSASSSSNYTLPAAHYFVYYNGTNYYFRTDGKLTASITGDAATVNGKTVAVNVPADAKFTDTTYESKAAASGGTALSLVTTGEKYTWNSKTSNTGTVTKVSTGVGLTGGDITTTGTIKAKLKSETASTLDSAAVGTTASRQYAVHPDKSGYLSVNVPWENTTYSSKAAASGGTEVSLVTTGEKYTWNNKTSNTGTVTSVATGAGLTGGTITTSGTLKCDLKSETKSTLEATAMGSTSGKQYAVGLDKNGDLSVNIPWTDNNTTYTFANGTNGFTVTPSGGSAQTVTVTPSITNNVTGSGTSGYLTKFNGTNTITNGPQLGSSTTTYLRNDATWANPQNVYVGSSAPSDSNYTVWVDTSGVLNDTAILNAFYPVGVVYFSTSSTSPGTLFGMGTWEAYSPDPFEGIHAWKRTA